MYREIPTRIWIGKFKEVLASILPITLIVTALNFTIVPLGPVPYARFLIGAAFIIVGLAAFLVGVDIGITPLGSRLGNLAARCSQLWLVALIGFGLGAVISLAEPDLHILATQVELVTEGLVGRWMIVLVVSLGLGLLTAIGLVRILLNHSLRNLLFVLYGGIFLASLASSPEFLAIAFDASGATTGAMTVPFILALAIGVSALKRGGQPHPQDSFGLVGLASVGAIIAVLAMGLITPLTHIAAPTVDLTPEPFDTLLGPFAYHVRHLAFESMLAVLPLLIMLLIGQAIFFHLTWRVLFRLLRGLFYAWLGLVLILTGVNAGFMHIGREVGAELAARGGWLLILIGFIIGLVTVLAEPAVHVLTRQIHRVTHGRVPDIAVLVALSLGVGTAVAFSGLRVLIPSFQLWHILLPGYVAAILLSRRNSELFVGMAFDAGGVVSGPMTATFILAYTQGAANQAQSANVLIDGFGVIALVALTPLLGLQIIGLLYGKRLALPENGSPGHPDTPTATGSPTQKAGPDSKKPLQAPGNDGPASKESDTDDYSP